jgi:plastocyanin
MAMSSAARFAAGLMILPVVAACFSDRPDATGPNNVPEYVSCNANAPAPPANVRVVRIRNFAFEPAQLAVASGTTVWWINCEAAGPSNSHTSTADAGAWDSPLLAPAGAGTYSRVFGAAGSFSYHCKPHPQMTARITVS